MLHVCVTTNGIPCCSQSVSRDKKPSTKYFLMLFHKVFIIIFLLLILLSKIKIFFLTARVNTPLFIDVVFLSFY